MKKKTIEFERTISALQSVKVLGAWVFGSARDGLIMSGSDVDIGVLFESQPSLNDLADLRAQLQQALSFEEVDVVPLNDASPILRFEAISGRRLICRDANRCAEFVSLTARQYEDEMAQYSRWTEEARPVARVAESGAPYERQGKIPENHAV